MEPIRIFISYSRDNITWLTEYIDEVKQKTNPLCLLKQWERTFRNDNVVFWYDKKEEDGIQGGEAWLERIFKEIDKADIAIMLVSPEFMVSPVIMDEEVPRILARHTKSVMEVLPILIKACRQKDLAKFNFLNWAQGGPTPLSECQAYSENEFDKAKNQILDSIESAISRVQKKRDSLHTNTTETPKPLQSPPHESDASDSKSHTSSQKPPITSGAKAFKAITNENNGMQPLPPLPDGASLRIATEAGLSLTIAAYSGMESFAAEVPYIFDPLLQIPAAAELLQLTRQLYDHIGFRSLSPREREIINSKMLTIIRSMGSALRDVTDTLPEADYLMALVFLLDMERISKMGSMVERDALLNIFPKKIEEYLIKYVRRAPNGKFTEKAKKLMTVAAGSIITHGAQEYKSIINEKDGMLPSNKDISEREALTREIIILAERTVPNELLGQIFKLKPDQEGILITVDHLFRGQRIGTQTFRMPGPHKFWSHNGTVHIEVKDSVNIEAKEYINLGSFDQETELKLNSAFTRLNALLLEEKAGKP